MDKKSSKKLRNFMIVYGSLLLLFVAYVLLDVFVIPRTFSAVNQSTSENNQQKNVESETTDTSYTSNNISITISTHREYDTTIYVADVKIKNADCLKTALAGNMYGRNLQKYILSLLL